MKFYIVKVYEVTSFGWFVKDERGISYAYCLTKVGAWLKAKRLQRLVGRTPQRYEVGRFLDLFRR